MAEVTGPISTLPGRSHTVPEGMTCDQHPHLPAVARIQGETDSFGCEMIDMCQECFDDYRAYMKSDEAKEARKGNCDWCKHFADDLREARDYEEGMCGPVYRVCDTCIRRVNEEAAAELAYLDDLDFSGPDDDYCTVCGDEGDMHGRDGAWQGHCGCVTGLRLKGEAEARYRAKSEAAR